MLRTGGWWLWCDQEEMWSWLAFSLITKVPDEGNLYSFNLNPREWRQWDWSKFQFFSVLKNIFPKLSVEKLLSTICPPFRASLEVSERCGNLPIKRTGSGRKWKGNIRERELAVVVILTLDQVPSTVCYRTNTFWGNQHSVLG